MRDILELLNNIVNQIPWISAMVIVTTICNNKPKHVCIITKFFKVKSDR